MSITTFSVTTSCKYACRTCGEQFNCVDNWYENNAYCTTCGIPIGYLGWFNNGISIIPQYIPYPMTVFCRDWRASHEALQYATDYVLEINGLLDTIDDDETDERYLSMEPILDGLEDKMEDIHYAVSFGDVDTAWNIAYSIYDDLQQAKMWMAFPFNVIGVCVPGMTDGDIVVEQSPAVSSRINTHIETTSTSRSSSPFQRIVRWVVDSDDESEIEDDDNEQSCPTDINTIPGICVPGMTDGDIVGEQSLTDSESHIEVITLENIEQSMVPVSIIQDPKQRFVEHYTIHERHDYMHPEIHAAYNAAWSWLYDTISHLYPHMAKTPGQVFDVDEFIQMMPLESTSCKESGFIGEDHKLSWIETIEEMDTIMIDTTLIRPEQPNHVCNFSQLQFLRVLQTWKLNKKFSTFTTSRDTGVIFNYGTNLYNCLAFCLLVHLGAITRPSQTPSCWNNKRPNKEFLEFQYNFEHLSIYYSQIGAIMAANETVEASVKFALLMRFLHTFHTFENKIPQIHHFSACVRYTRWDCDIQKLTHISANVEKRIQQLETPEQGAGAAAGAGTGAENAQSTQHAQHPAPNTYASKVMRK